MKSKKDPDRTIPERTRRNHTLAGHGAGVIGRLVRLLLLLVVTTGAVIGFLFSVRFFWYAYMSSPAGHKFASLFAEESDVISETLSRDMIHLSVEVTLTAFFICVILAIICRSIYLVRYFYIPHGLFFRFAFWGLPLTAAVAFGIEYRFGIASWWFAFFLAFVPTMCMFSECLRRAYDMIPELGDIFSGRTG